MSSKNDPSLAFAARWSPSIALRLTLWYTAATFLLAIGLTVGLYTALARNLAREDDELLQDQIAILRGILRERPNDQAAILQEVEWESLLREHSKTYLRILDGTGTTLVETPGMPVALSPGAFPTPDADSGSDAHGADLRGEDGTPFRALSAMAWVGPDLRETRTLQVALDRTSEERLLRGFRRGAIPLLLASLALCALFGHRIARRGILPIEQMARAVRGVRSTTLHERISTEGWPAELHLLADSFNEMLSRLEDAFGRISRFSSDIAHELRTPLTNLRGELEVTASKSRSPEEYRRVLESGLEEAERLSRLVESLLFLARAEHPETRIERSEVSVSEELEKIREFYEPAAQEKGLALDLSVTNECRALVDRTLFQRAVSNLVENALAHTPQGGRITLRAAESEGWTRVEVQDTGVGIPAAHLPRVFERLYRVDGSRAACQGGAGLGLSIVQSVLDLHGGKTEIESDAGEGTTVRLSFPSRMTESS